MNSSNSEIKISSAPFETGSVRISNNFPIEANLSGVTKFQSALETHDEGDVVYVSPSDSGFVVRDSSQHTLGYLNNTEGFSPAYRSLQSCRRVRATITRMGYINTEQHGRVRWCHITINAYTEFYAYRPTLFSIGRGKCQHLLCDCFHLRGKSPIEIPFPEQSANTDSFCAYCTKALSLCVSYGLDFSPCPDCHALNSNFNTRCMECGSIINPHSTQEPLKMDLTTCPECGQVVPVSVPDCPGCGFPLLHSDAENCTVSQTTSQAKQPHFVLPLILILGLLSMIVTLVAYFSSTARRNTIDPADTSLSDDTASIVEDFSPAPSYLYIGESAQLDGVTVTLLDVKWPYFPPSGRNPSRIGYSYAAFHFKIENNGTESISVNRIHFKCYADGHMCNAWSGAPDSQNPLALTDLAPGNTVDGYCFYAVPYIHDLLTVEYVPQTSDVLTTFAGTYRESIYEHTNNNTGSE